MTIHLQKFVDRVRAFEARASKDFVMSMEDAKNLHADISRLLIALQSSKDNVADSDSKPDTIEVKISGGTFK
jgi:hypothetical protein